MSSPAYVRTLTGWPDDVPETLLVEHVNLALAWAQAKSGYLVAPDGKTLDWDAAVAWRAASTALPALHAFALAGAAKVGRLEATVEWRFMTPHEVAGLATRWQAMADEHVARLSPAPEEGVAGPIGMEAV